MALIRAIIVLREVLFQVVGLGARVGRREGGLTVVLEVVAASLP